MRLFSTLAKSMLVAASIGFLSSGWVAPKAQAEEIIDGPADLREGQIIIRGVAYYKAPIQTLGKFEVDKDLNKVYGQISYRNLTRAVIKMHGVQVDYAPVLDEYGVIEHCEIYRNYFSDDFAWTDIRNKLLEEIIDNAETWTSSFYINSVMDLDRYDVERGGFIIKSSNAIDRLALFDLIVRRDRHCLNGLDIEYFPNRYWFELQKPISIPMVPVELERARRLRLEWENAGNYRRRIYVTFKMSAEHVVVDGVAPSSSLTARFIGDVDEVRFYLDEERTDLLYKYTFLKDDEETDELTTDNPFD